MSKKDILILGFGSEILSDEGLALRLTTDLKNNWFNHADINNFLTFSLDVVHEIAGYKTLFLIDTYENASVGKLQTFSIENYKQTLHLNNYHDIALTDGINLGFELGLKMPADIYIIAISISNIGYINNSLSPEIEENYTQILTKVESVLKERIFQSVS